MIENIIILLWSVQLIVTLIVIIVSIITVNLKFNGENLFGLFLTLTISPFVLGLMLSKTDAFKVVIEKTKNKLDLYKFLKKQYTVSIMDARGSTVTLTKDQQKDVNTAVVTVLGR